MTSASRPSLLGSHLHRDEVEGVHRVEHAGVNFYVVEDGGRLTIVDAGHPTSWRVLLRFLAELGRSPGDIEAIVLTHGHFDHVGFAERARRRLGVEVWAPVADVGLARNPWRYPHERSRALHALTHPRFVPVFAAMGAAGALLVRGVEKLRSYDDGERLDVPGSPRVIATPGHTPGHCALMLDERGALLAGDAIVSWNPYTGRTGPQIVSRAATGASDQALQSLEPLAATGAPVVLTGHGPALTQGARAAADEALAVGAT
jgi:glyoxylase-like metal-dependent hydrolase (beta-lactamase superfamily II)